MHRKIKELLFTVKFLIPENVQFLTYLMRQEKLKVFYEIQYMA